MHLFFRLSIFLTVTFFISQFNVGAQDRSKEFTPGYYVVVGTFKVPENAEHFNQALKTKGYSSNIGADKDYRLRYVYVEKSAGREQAILTVNALRQESFFADAWIKTVAGKIEVPENSLMEESASVDGVTLSEPAATIDDLPSERRPTQFAISNTEVFLYMYNASNDHVVEGEVQIVDTERARLIEKVKGNDYYTLADPKSSSKRLTLIGEVFGYRKVQLEVNYPLALTDSSRTDIEMVGTIIMVNFDMVRYQKGDISILYNVYFFNDAAIMQPESKFELNNLLSMMLENSNYRIRLHGHTNGNYTGKIITLGDEKNFFSLTGSNETRGSAKELAEQRAEIIKAYLVASGIDASCVEVKAWGGKRPLYDKNSANAKKNVRVEVEILQQ